MKTTIGSFFCLWRTQLMFWSLWNIQAIHVDEAEYMHAGSMGFVLSDYPASGANNRHSPYPGGTRWKEDVRQLFHSAMVYLTSLIFIRMPWHSLAYKNLKCHQMCANVVTACASQKLPTIFLSWGYTSLREQMMTEKHTLLLGLMQWAHY